MSNISLCFAKLIAISVYYIALMFIHNMFCTFLYNNCDDGVLFKSVFYRKYDAIRIVSGQPLSLIHI